jgi:glycosyltransferase involved in cell wall biosynthesis
MTDEPATQRWRLPDSLEGVGIVYFGNSWNTENRTSSHHIAVQLASQMPVMYVDSPGMRGPSATSRDVRKMIRTVSTAASKPRQISENLWHSTVPQLPYRRVPGVERINHGFGVWAARRAMACIACRDWISWFVVPHLGLMAGALGEKLCVYYCVDDYAAHPGVDSDVMTRLDRHLTCTADQVFVAPPAIVDAKKALNPHTVFSPHGVDASLFARARDPTTPVPEAAQRLSRPVVGFFGLIADWIDVELIAFMARARPQWSFLLVGHVYADTRLLDDLKNIVMVGAQSYESLPGWAKAFDVAIIPYRDVRQTRNANPLKLREYLATGCPVVATPTPEVERFREWVRIASTGPEFIMQIEAALREESMAAGAARMEAVKSMTWVARVQSVLDVVGARVTERSARLPQNSHI